MKTIVAAVVGSLLLSTSALAADPAPAMDLTKMGPVLRKPTQEKKTKEEVETFIKAGEAVEKSGDFEAGLSRIDFPLFMATDSVKGGVPEGRLYSKEEYVALMKPMMGAMPKDLKTTHKPTLLVMSDSLVGVNDEWTMAQGKTKVSGRNFSLVVKREGAWKYKTLVEAGWGGATAAVKH